MKIVLANEIYPPRAGGAGWSTRALALALKEAGHEIVVVTTSAGPPDLDGLDVRRLAWSGRKRFAVPRAFAAFIETLGDDAVIHAQHPLAALGALHTRHIKRVAVTIRDHWPICFWSTRISRGEICPRCGLVPMTRCMRGHVAVPAPLSWAVIPYMRWDLHEKRNALRHAGALIAVSEAVAAEVRNAGLPAPRVIPNIVDARELARVADAAPLAPVPERFLLFIGKLEANKGVQFLAPAVAAAATGLTLVVLGEGSLARSIKHDARAADVPLIFRGWAHREEALRVLARATTLVFPSLWPEPLSRVLLEALALGVPVAAVDTGGTHEILVPEESGLLVSSIPELGSAIERLVRDEALRRKIAAGARLRSQAFSPERLVPRYEAVYRELL
ncbi:MAG: glycosyltransferase family 4 protein [Vicinamibacteria bacterium]|nr:glycosyltransferase family 4 protein [Vicinamibacteria bacterium]